MDEESNNWQGRVAVVMAVHNRRAATLACLEQLASQTLPVAQRDIFVVDDGSADGTSGAIKAAFPDVKVLLGDGSLYWGNAMALAEREAVSTGADFILWLNDDIQMVPDALERLISIANSSKERPIVVGALSDEDSRATTYSGYTRKRAQYGFLRLERKDPHPTSAQRVDTFNGNIVLIPTPHSRRIGGVDRTFTHHYGDLDFGLRAKKAGIEVLLAHGYAGVTNRNAVTSSFRDREAARVARFKNLVGPKGFPPRERWEYFRRHGGFLWPFQCVGFYIFWALRIIAAK